MRKGTLLIVVGLCLSSGAAWAAKGFHYVATTVTTGSNMKQADTLVIETWVKNASAKVLIREASEANPLLAKDKYILTTDGGETFWLVDPVENTHSKFDMSQVLGLLGAFSDSGMLDMKVSNYSLDELERGDGPEMHGYDTEYRKYRTEYDLEVQILRMRRADHYVLDHEVWTVDRFQASGFQAWMQPRETGFEAVDTLLKGELEKVKGLAFKSVTRIETQGAKKKKRVTTQTATTTIDEFEAMNVADSMFELDPDSREVPLLGLGAGQAQQGDGEPEEEKGGFMKRLKKLKKGDG